MAKQIYIDKALSIAGPGDQYPARVLGVIARDTDESSVVLELVQTAALTARGIAVRPYGMIVIPNMDQETLITLVTRDVVTGEETTYEESQLKSIHEGVILGPAGESGGGSE